MTHRTLADGPSPDYPDRELGPGHGGGLGAPWTLTEDNAERIEVKDDHGETVWLEDWANLPDDFDPHQRELVVSSVRSRIHATIAAVNGHAGLVKQLMKARDYVAASAKITRLTMLQSPRKTCLRLDPAAQKLGAEEAARGVFRLSVDDILGRSDYDIDVLAYLTGWLEARKAKSLSKADAKGD